MEEQATYQVLWTINSFQSVISGPAASTSSGDLLVMQVLRPYPWPTESETGHGAQKSVSQQTLQVIPMCSIKSLVTIYLKKKNCSGGMNVTQSVIEARVQLCKDNAIEDYQVATPGKERLCFCAQLSRGSCGPANWTPLMVGEVRN